jgi:hypothetical protein
LRRYRFRRAPVRRGWQFPQPNGCEPMPQIQLPLFPAGVTHITAVLAFSKQDGRVTYFNGRQCQAGGHRARLRGDEDQPQAGGEALPPGRTERVLRPAQAARAAGLGATPGDEAGPAGSASPLVRDRNRRWTGSGTRGRRKPAGAEVCGSRHLARLRLRPTRGEVRTLALIHCSQRPSLAHTS